MSTPLVHKSNNKLVAGVSGRLGRRFDVDIGLVRAGFVIGLMAEPFTTISIYLALAYVLPRVQGASESSDRVSSAGDVSTDYGATARDACRTGYRLAAVLGAVAYAISRAGLAAGRAAATAGSAAFRTRQPARRFDPPSAKARPTVTGHSRPSARATMRQARRAAVASRARGVASPPRVATVPPRARYARPQPAPTTRSTPPARRSGPQAPARSTVPAAAPALAPAPAHAPAPRAWLSDEERLEADVRAAVARTEEQAQRDLAATAAAAKRARKMRRRRRMRRTLGALAVTGGTLWLASQVGMIAPEAITVGIQSPTVWAIALMAGGTWLVLSSLWRR